MTGELDADGCRTLRDFDPTGFTGVHQRSIVNFEFDWLAQPETMDSPVRVRPELYEWLERECTSEIVVCPLWFWGCILAVPNVKIALTTLATIAMLARYSNGALALAKKKLKFMIAKSIQG
jgi:hypothetical protein